MTTSDLCEEIYRQTLEAVRADRLLAQYLSAHEGLNAWITEEPIWILGAGKAAAWIAEGLAQHPGTAIAGGLLAVKEGHTRPRLPIEQIESGHPIPNEASLQAGTEMLALADRIPGGARVVGIVTGGASALLEHLNEGATLADLQAATRKSMEGGQSIQELNQIRRQFSDIKGGRLADRLTGHPLQVFVLNDVIGGGPEVIGSGPFWTGLDGAPHHQIGSWKAAVKAAYHAAQHLGLEPITCFEPLTGSDRECAALLVSQIRGMTPGQALICAGEPTVEVNGEGMGGRCQQIAARVADRIRGDKGVSFLAAGTDGTDGPTDAAGALVDGGSANLARAKMIELTDVLIKSNSYDWCQAAGAHVRTGPTGSNVNDLFLAVRDATR